MNGTRASLAARLAVLPALIALWQALAWIAGERSYILPGPLPVARIWLERSDQILDRRRAEE